MSLKDRFPKLNICGGEIHAKIRQQDGTFTPVVYPLTLMNCLFVDWLQVHD